MTLKIVLNSNAIDNLDLSPATKIIESILAANIGEHEQKLYFEINYKLEKTDPRELSEIPEIRLWFVRLDSFYPWLPFFLDWKQGELARYAAMLVPHQFHRTEGIKYNPEALEIFVMHKIFILSSWLKKQGLSGHNRLQLMAQMFGYEIDNDFFIMLEND